MYKNYINLISSGIFSRISGSAIRFFIPLYIISYSIESQLGLYYLAISILTSAASISGLDFGYLYSTKYLKSNKFNLKNVFNSFILKALSFHFLFFILGTFFSLVFFIIYELPAFIIFIPLLISLEAITFEVGKFFWNIGNSKQASTRDFFKSTVLFAALISSIYFYNEIISILSISMLILFNLVLLIFELIIYGSIKDFNYKKIFLITRTFKSLIGFSKELISVSAPQYIQNQMIGILTLFERVFLTSIFGLSVQGIYSFIYSIISITVSLFLIPLIAKTRKTIISDHPNFSKPEIYLTAIKILPQIILGTLIIFGISYFVIPDLYLFLKGIYITDFLIIIIAASISSVNNSYMATVAPLYGQWSNIIKSNLYTFVIMSPFLILSTLTFTEDTHQMISLFIIIILIAIAQSLIRLLFFIKSYKVYQKEL